MLNYATFEFNKFLVRVEISKTSGIILVKIVNNGRNPSRKVLTFYSQLFYAH